ncbi:Uncharacterised protein [Burkholderia pseudomallei]|nr:Uncharacterised protein [Burkholderia pseudomallei]
MIKQFPIWEAPFPMFWIVKDQTFVALDTNRLPSNLLTSALGDVGAAQLRRLKQIAGRLTCPGIFGPVET